MKVAIVHDYIKEYGGAERVLEALHEIWPKSTVFTSLYLPEFLGPHRERFNDWNIKTSVFQRFLFKSKIISPLRIFTRNIFESFDLTGFDLIIVSATGAYIPNLIRKNKKSLHICYCHTPPRYLYGYPTARLWKKSIFGRIAGEFVNHYLRLMDYTAAQNPDFYIANSNEVKNRIKKFYRREAKAIYPPVDQVSGFRFQVSEKRKNSYYLAGGRLARAKHIDLVINAANKLKFNLKIFGKAFAGYDKELKKIAGATVEFVGEVTDEKLQDLYRNCRALIFASEYEDFGIMPVEVQAQGRPVIAFRSGGVTESVIDGKTGVFFDNLSVDSIAKAIKRLEKINIKDEVCRRNAELFSKERFKREIVNFIESHLRQKATARRGKKYA